MTNAQNRFADALRWVFPMTVASHLEFRGWVREALKDSRSWPASCL